jgi:very-short-patch-repair endonuclease
MVPGELELSLWLRQHHGVASRGQLKALGFSSRRIDRLTSCGRFHIAQRGVYIATDWPPSLHQRALAACLATGGALSHASAARLWEFRSIPNHDSIHVTIPNTRFVEPQHGIVIHRSTSFEPNDLVYRDDGISIASPPRTAFDVARYLNRFQLESVIEQGIDRGTFTVPTLWSITRRLAGPGRPGSGQFTRVLTSREAWVKPLDSKLELLFENAVRRARLPTPERQFAIRLHARLEIHPDFVWPAQQLIVEIDHVTWHGGRVASGRDKWRDRKTLALGWTTVRIPDTDIKLNCRDVVRDVAAIFRSRPSLQG